MTWTTRTRARIVLAATVAGVALTASLGFWQLDRAAQKEALQTALEQRSVLPVLGAAELAADPARASSQHFRRTLLRGHWRSEHTVFLENRQMDGRTGFHVVTPLQLVDRSDTVLVQRGWVPRNLMDRTSLPPIAATSASVEVTGTIAPPPARLYEFGKTAGGTIRQNLNLSEFAVETNLALLPLSVLQADSAAATGDGLLRHWPRPATDIQRHYGYAFQWFALAALMTGLHVWFQLVRPRLRPAA